MNDTSVGLLEIMGCSNTNRQADVIFIHGLTGHPLTTWHPEEKKDKDSWLYWLGSDLPNIAVWSYGYEAEFSNFKGKAMPQFDQASNLMDWLESKELAKRPIIFVTHSLGGLLVKQLLRNAQSYKDEKFSSNLIRCTKGIVFLATPHTGSHLANLVRIIGKFIRTTITVEELKAHNPWLRDIDIWYRQNVWDLGIETRVYYETRDTLGFKVVDEDSANPKLKDVRATAVPADHISIAKPGNKGDLVYLGVSQFIKSILEDSDGSLLPLLKTSEEESPSLKSLRRKRQWQYLEPHPSSWRKQLYFKGRKLTAFTVWSDMIANEDTINDTANNWGLPIEAIREAIVYCETNQELLKLEAEEERRYLEDTGVIFEPKITHR